MCCNMVTSADELETDAPADSKNDEQDNRPEIATNVVTTRSLRIGCLTNEVYTGYLVTQSDDDVCK